MRDFRDVCGGKMGKGRIQSENVSLGILKNRRSSQWTTWFKCLFPFFFLRLGVGEKEDLVDSVVSLFLISRIYRAIEFHIKKIKIKSHEYKSIITVSYLRFFLVR